MTDNSDFLLTIYHERAIQAALSGKQVIAILPPEVKSAFIERTLKTRPGVSYEPDADRLIFGQSDGAIKFSDPDVQSDEPPDMYAFRSLPKPATLHEFCPAAFDGTPYEKRYVREFQAPPGGKLAANVQERDCWVTIRIHLWPADYHPEIEDAPAESKDETSRE